MNYDGREPRINQELEELLGIDAYPMKTGRPRGWGKHSLGLYDICINVDASEENEDNDFYRWRRWGKWTACYAFKQSTLTKLSKTLNSY